MYLRPPSASEEARINDWIKVRQSGIRYYLSLGDQRKKCNYLNHTVLKWSQKDKQKIKDMIDE